VVLKWIQKNHVVRLAEHSFKQILFPQKTQPSLFTVDKKEPEDMVFIPDGEFLLGTKDRDGFPADGEDCTLCKGSFFLVGQIRHFQSKVFKICKGNRL